MPFSTLLSHYRKHAGLTQTALAKKIGVSLSYMNAIECDDKVPPSRTRCEEIAKALCLQPDETLKLLELAFQERNEKELNGFNVQWSVRLKKKEGQPEEKQK